MGLDGPNAFKQLQGSEIDKVEIITNPLQGTVQKGHLESLT